MEARAEIKYARISPERCKSFSTSSATQPVDVAMAIVQHTPKAACEPVSKLLKSATANAENNSQHGSEQPLCCRMLSLSRTDSQAYPSESSGPVRTVSKENVAYHPGAQRERISEEEEELWDRKSIPTAFVSVSSGLGFPLVRQRESDSAIPWCRTITCANTRRRPCTPPACRKSRSNATPPACASIFTAPSPASSSAKGGAEIEKLRQTCEKMLGKPTLINIVEVRNPDVNAQLVAENIAAQLEKRISFRRAMKQLHRPRHAAGRQGH